MTIDEKKHRELVFDAEMYLWLKNQKIDSDDDEFWEMLWQEFYKWNRTRIKFVDKKVAKVLKTKELMGALKEDLAVQVNDPDLVRFRNKMNEILEYIGDPHHPVSMQVWMDEECWEWRTRVQRKFDLVPPMVDINIRISDNVCDLYAETRECYISGQFRAAISLSRSVIECAIKDKWKRQPNDQDWTAGKGLMKMLEIKQIDRKTYEIGDDVVVRANNILHAGASLSWEEALYFIDKTKDFLEGFYKK